MDPSDQVYWPIIAAISGSTPLSCCGSLVPARLIRQSFFGINDLAKKLNVARREEVESPINVYNLLPCLRAYTVNHGRVLGRRWVWLVLRRCLSFSATEHHNARPEASLVRCIVPDPLIHLLSETGSLVCAPRAFLPGEGSSERPDEVVLGAQKHATDQISRRYSWGSFHNQEPTGRFHKPVAIFPVAVGRYIITMYDEVTAIMGNPRERSDVGGVRN